GGVWADQSWGRFWGWDPKENGALLIVLWLVWLIHGKMSGHVKHVYYLAGLSFLSVIVALSWFGVNLLSVGLHSYGFIEGIALGLFTFCFVEILVLSGLVYREVKGTKHEA
ncbi:MAG: cytochrome c biogenesis protein CcsA, partial [Bdellovibrionales bacterium]